MSVNGSFNSSVSGPTSVSGATYPTGIDPVEFWILLVLSYGVLGGLAGSIGNAALVIGVIRDKQLRTRFYVMLCFLLSARTVVGVQDMINFTHRTLRTLNIVSVNMNRASCYLILMQLYYALTLEMVFLLALVIDKILAIAAYKYYSKLTYKQAFKTCVIATVCVLIAKLVPSFFGVDFTDTIPCVNVNSPLSPQYTFYVLNVDSLLAVLILVLYIVLIIYVRFWFLPLTQAAGQTSGHSPIMVAYKNHTKLLPTLTRLVLLHCGFTLTSKIAISFMSFLPFDTQVRLAMYIAGFLAIDYIANIVALLVCNRDLRKATLPCYYGNIATSVVAIQMTSTGQGSRLYGRKLR